MECLEATHKACNRAGAYYRTDRKPLGSRLSNAKSSPWVLVRRTIPHYLSYFGSPNISLPFSYLFSIRARSCRYCEPSPEAQAEANPSHRRANLSHRLKRAYGIRLGRRIIPCTSSADLTLLSAIASASRRISPTSRASSSIRFLFTSMLCYLLVNSLCLLDAIQTATFAVRSGYYASQSHAKLLYFAPA